MKDSTFLKRVAEDELMLIKLKIRASTDLEEIKALKGFRRKIKESLKEDSKEVVNS